MDFVTEHSAYIVTAGVIALEIVLRRIPNAWPITKIVYQMLDKIVKDRKD